MAVEITKGQMDLFGNIFGEEAVTEENNTSTKANAKTANAIKKTSSKGQGKVIPAVAKEPEPPIKVHGDWNIDYYGNSFEVSDFVDEIPEEGIEIDVLREEMQKEFFGLSKERAYWEVDEQNEYIFMFVKGTSKGSL